MRWLLLALLLVGCTTVETRIAKVPQPPVIEVPEKPTVPEGAPVNDKVRALAEYILILQARLQQALTALEVYRKEE